MRILFWNTHNNEHINTILSELIIENNINIAILAEYKADILLLIDTLSEQGIKMKQYMAAGCDRIIILGNIANVEPGWQSSHVSIQIINKKYILCCVHLSSQIYTNNEGYREIDIQRIITYINDLEKEISTENTIIVGDFNMNPFDKLLVSANYFHGLPFYDVAKRKHRTIAGQKFTMFYNPMWNLLGDFKKPYGTYYHSGNAINNTYWHLYDQVIIRPALRNHFVDESLKIVTKTETKCLTNSKGHPDKKTSDHLPIIFEIKEN